MNERVHLEEIKINNWSPSGCWIAVVVIKDGPKIYRTETTFCSSVCLLII